MSEPGKSRKQRFVSWVNGEREPQDRTLFVLEKRHGLRVNRTPEEHEQRERHRLRRFLGWYPLAAILVCTALSCVLLAAVVSMPLFGNPKSPINNEVSEHYLENTEEETGATNAVTGMILTYRGFDTLGESCVLFLACACVMILLRRDEKNTDDRDLARLQQEDEMDRKHPDIILQDVSRLLIPFIFLFAVYVLLNGESSPGGGFSGGTVLGCGLILFAAAFGFERIRVFFNGRVYAAVRTFGLLLYAGLYGYFIFKGANGLSNPLELNAPIDLAVGLVVACTVYGFYGLFSRGDVSC